MDEQNSALPEQEQEPIKSKSAWQHTKERWYDKVPLTLKQLDSIIYVCLGLLVILGIVITLDAMDIFNPFGY